MYIYRGVLLVQCDYSIDAAGVRHRDEGSWGKEWEGGIGEWQVIVPLEFVGEEV